MLIMSSDGWEFLSKLYALKEKVISSVGYTPTTEVLRYKRYDALYPPEEPHTCPSTTAEAPVK